MAKKYNQDEFQAWLIDKASSMPAHLVRRHIAGSGVRGDSNTIAGKLYFFKYNPLFKDKLPQYDKFPMCLAIENISQGKNGLGFLGLNLHYIGVGEREALLSRLYEYNSNKYTDERARMKINYDIIKSTRKLNSLARPCVKRYLMHQCRSQFIEIYPEEYDIAIQLPVEEWVYNR